MGTRRARRFGAHNAQIAALRARVHPHESARLVRWVRRDVRANQFALAQRRRDRRQSGTERELLVPYSCTYIT